MRPSGEDRDTAPRSSPLVDCPVCSTFDLDHVAAALHAARRAGGSWAEVFLEHRDSHTLRYQGNTFDARSDRDVGAGLRVGGAIGIGYASTTVLTPRALLAAAAAAGSGQPPRSGLGESPPALVDRPVHAAHRPRRPTDSADLAVKADIVRAAAAAAQEAGREVKDVSVTYVDVTQHVLIATDDGGLWSDARTRTRLTCRVVARGGDRRAVGFEGPGLGGGLELFDASPPEGTGAAAAQRAITMLAADRAPTGVTSVVLGPAAGGLLLHEACGHGLEGDGLAYGTSVYGKTAKARLAGPDVTIVDDPGRPGGFGSYGVDDEGRPARRTVLIDRGVQIAGLTDTITADRLATPASANGRRESFTRPPLCRMSNTYLDRASDAPADIVSSIRRGIYVARLSGGDVDPTTGEFAFSASEAYLIEQGNITRPVTGLTLLGNGPDALTAMRAVGDDLAFTEAMCGKDGQWVPVSYGSPTLLIDGLMVTGSAP